MTHSRAWSAEVSGGESWEAGGRHNRVRQVVPGHGLNRRGTVSPRGLHRRPRVQKIVTTEVSSSNAQLGECWTELLLTRSCPGGHHLA